MLVRRRGVADQPEFDRCYRRNHEADHQVSPHSERIVVEPEHTGANDQPRANGEVDPLLRFKHFGNGNEFREISNRENGQDCERRARYRNRKPPSTRLSPSTMTSDFHV